MGMVVHVVLVAFNQAKTQFGCFSDRSFVCIRGQKVLQTNHAQDAVSLQPKKAERAEC